MEVMLCLVSLILFMMNGSVSQRAQKVAFLLNLNYTPYLLEGLIQMISVIPLGRHRCSDPQKCLSESVFGLLCHSYKGKCPLSTQGMLGKPRFKWVVARDLLPGLGNT